MAAPISLRGDFDGPMLRALVLAEKAGSVTRRLLSLVTIYDGGSRADAARLGGVGLQTHSRLGPPVQFQGAGWPRRRQVDRASLETQRRAKARARRNGRGRSDPGGPWGRALEADRSRAMGVR
jgi:hypothetical protein